MKINHFNSSTAKAISFVLTSLTLGLATTGIASAAVVRTGFDSNFIPRNDDGSAPITALGFTANFFGTNYSNAFVNNNGNITFNNALSTFTPFGITGVTTPIIAPFFADVDTNNSATSPVTYGTGTVNGNAAFAANYRNVGYYPSAANKINDFQVVLISRADTGSGNFDIEFNYDRIQWETGGASGGSNGLGGTSAAAGYSNGLGGAANVSYEFVGSRVNGAFLDGGPAATSLIANSLNSGGLLGRYTFNARNGEVVILPPPPTEEPTGSSPGPTAVPEPFTIVGTLIGGTAALRMRKKLKSND